MSVHLILYSKPGCHLCEGLQEKLLQIQSLDLTLDVRDITTRDDWSEVYQYEIPVLVLVKGEGRGERSQASQSVSRRESGGVEGAEGAAEAGEAIQNLKLETQNSKLKTSSLIPLPRPSPRATVQQLEQMLRKYL